MKEIIVDNNNANQKLHKLLNKILKEASMGFIYKMLRKKNITLNDRKASGDEVLKSGDIIKIFFSDETFDKLSGSNNKSGDYSFLKELNSSIDIIHEDKDKIIINKPAGILSQKAEENDVSINEMALSYLINKGELSLEDFSVFHPSVVNRLDRNTSGIIVFAKNLRAAQYLSKEIKERTATKLYMAVVKGQVKENLTVEGYLFKDEVLNKVTISDKPFKEAKPVKTAYEPVFYNENKDVTVLRIHLITGRTHQIRAHLAYLNHPLIGDNKYGDKNLNRKLNARHQLLHAYHIEFSNGESFEAKLPEEINVYL